MRGIAPPRRGKSYAVMLAGFAWSKGLPLAAEEKVNVWYSKRRVADARQVRTPRLSAPHR